MENVSDLMVYGGYRALRTVERMRETLIEHQVLVDGLLSGDVKAALEASTAHIAGAKRRFLS